MTSEGGDAQWTSAPDWWGQAYWKGQWTRPEVAWESPPEEDIPSNVRSPSHKDDASNADAAETRDWGNQGWSRQSWAWDSWDASDRWRPWRWTDWSWKSGWGWGGYGGWGGWDRGWGWGNWSWGGWSGDSWRRNDGWSWDRERGWKEPEGGRWSWWQERDDAQRQGWNQREGQGWWSHNSEVPEAGREERERWEPEAPAALEDELESTTEQNQGFCAFAAEMTAEQQEHHEESDPGPEPFFGEQGGGSIRLPSIPEQPALEETSPSAAPVEDQPLHAHENEEWYQKWLRRQRNQPSHVVEIGAPPAAAPSAPPAVAPLRPDAASASSASSATVAEVAETIDPSEQRVCPDDGKTYTFEELQEAYKGEYSKEDLKGYWRDAMVIPGEKVAGTSEDYKQEEWYQKWLRRQQNKNRQIIEIG